MSADKRGASAASDAAEQGNHDVVAANAESIEALLNAISTVHDIGQRQQDMADFQLGELERGRRAATIEALTYKGLLAALLIVVSL